MKKAMLINIIDRIAVAAYGKINVVYKVKLENMGEDVTSLPPDGGEPMDIPNFEGATAIDPQKESVKGYALVRLL
ncbi:MAG: hypothetical protein LBE09_09315 [Christensenellaceae bacterium]|nr:hypothetical protein [Christensenellaceae bacterium]